MKLIIFLHLILAIVELIPGSSSTVSEVLYKEVGPKMTMNPDYATDCNLIPSNAIYIKIVMGSVVDYFKPVEGKTYCEMLQSNKLHQWSSNGKEWVIPLYYPVHFGGSAINYPTDGRDFLSFWGFGAGANNNQGGCCHNSYSDVAQWLKPFNMFYGIGTPDSSSLDDHALECTSKVEKANCEMVEGQCWCFHEGGISGSSVCGYPDGYSGEYYSIATDSKPSPHTIIKAFGKIPNPKHCNLDTKTGCDSDSLSNVCNHMPHNVTHCHGTHFGSQYTNKQRWERANAALAGGFVRCKDIEDKIQMCSDKIQNQDETGIDCGGSCKKACPTCDDGIQNQDETGLDCGGSCAACATCNDEIQNQDETGIDCGGVCSACTGSFVMIDSGDCESNGMRMVTTKKECEDAAVFLKLEDTSAYESQKLFRPKGCVYTTLEFLIWDQGSGQNQDKNRPACGSVRYYQTSSCICSKADDNDKEKDDGPTAEQCQKFIEEACPKETGCLEEDTRYMGSNIQKKSMKKKVFSAEDCQKICQENPDCLFFVWNSDKNQCVLKKEKGAVRKNCGKSCAGKVSGPKNCKQPRMV